VYVKQEQNTMNGAKSINIHALRRYEQPVFTMKRRLAVRATETCSERLTLSQTSLTTSRLAEDLGAGCARDNGLRMREDGRDRKATWWRGVSDTPSLRTTQEHTRALDIHEERVGRLHEALELVLLLLMGSGRVQQINGESLDPQDQPYVRHATRMHTIFAV
jgi:hypothetical protein